MKIQKINFAQNQYKNNYSSNNNLKKTQYTQQNELSNIYYKPLNFGKSLKEHNSWGARYNPETNQVSFKIFTFPDAKSVFAIVKNPSKPDIIKRVELENKGGGVFEKKQISSDIAKPNDEYQFEITKSNGEIQTVKDPYSFCQPELNGPSVIYDNSTFNWQNDKNWQNNPSRIKRGNDSIKNARIYALNPDTISLKRSYEGVKSKLGKIKKDGFNAVEIMHIENTYKYNWGYDGVDKHAPSAYLGGGNKLKDLVDECHKQGLNVIFDVVPNHIGPDGNQLEITGPYTAGPNDFGSAINYEGQNCEYVRDWMINAMLNWAQNYHVDGFRLDMTKYMNSDYTLKQLAAEMNYHFPDVFLIAEDARENIEIDNAGNYWSDKNQIHDKRITSKLKDYEYGKGQNEQEHTNRIYQIINNNANLSRIGMDSEWEFNYYHKLKSALFEGKTDDLIQAVLSCNDNVKYTMSHDEIGNYEGSRNIAKLMAPKLMLEDSICLLQKDIQRAKEYSKLCNCNFENALSIISKQKAQFAAEEIAIKLQTGELEKYKTSPQDDYSTQHQKNEQLYNEVLMPIGISTKYTYGKIFNAFEKAFEQTKAAQAFTFSIPGPKMVFQGDENADLTPFRFFREFQSIPDENYLYIQKGYREGKSALEESTLGKIKYSKCGKQKMKEFENLTRDLNKLNEQNPAISMGNVDVNSTVNHNLSKVAAFSTKDVKSNNEVFTVANFGDTDYGFDKDNEYYIKFPKGNWVEILNTDSSKYGGTDEYLNKNIINSDGNSNCSINLSGYSTCCFKKID